ncbi:hypothetical protein FKG94_18865 [Exilibacterium tricleocarpae]|uniref:Uncharacterized protein n=1 Tax=Exilibacterium tricleocarpae TaxID=2591008 RepID=A0A545T3C6_9GAMM|nr:tetratricopeptide repeat protein [Exilibacterium tricleocarpae]TQV71716.1 hypothetical protein FKG94_18865 [Exilibacterium tricleocarpae]
MPEAPVPEPETPPPSRPILPGQAPPAVESSALRSVIDSCWDHYRAGRWDDAIATAERGLRIERRSAELYLVLARAYSAMDERDQAQAFARQGLRYSDHAPAAVGAQLRSVLGAGANIAR